MPAQRLIRRQPLLQRLSSFPQDLLLSLNESYELLEWDSLSDSLSVPNGITLNLIYLLARLDQTPAKTTYHDKAVFQGTRIRDSGVFLGKTGGIHTILYLVSWGLVMFSIANALRCFTKKKNYRMFDPKPNTELSSPHARRVTLDSPVTYSPGIFSSVTSLVQSLRPSTPNLSEDGSKKQAWELSIWDPGSFNLNTFCWFSPLHLLIINYLAHTSVLITIILLLLNTIQLSMLIHFSTTQQKDKQTLYTQVLSEYNTKFIEPRLSVRKRDIGTSTPQSFSPNTTPTHISTTVGTDTPTGDDSIEVEIATPSYGASGASLQAFRRKYGPVQHTPIQPKLSHSVSVGPDLLRSPNGMFSPLSQQGPGRPSFVSPNAGGTRPSSKGVGSFDLWSAGGKDFPSPVKGVSKSTSTPALVRPPSRGPTYVSQSPVKPGRKRRSGGETSEVGDKPSTRKW